MPVRQRLLMIGEPAPWFTARSTNNANFHFDTIAGRYIVLCFFGSAGMKTSQRILEDIWSQRAVFDDQNCCFFGVSVDPEDEKQPRIQPHIPGVRFFWDFNGAISQQYGAITATGNYRQFTLVLDYSLRVLAVLPFNESPETHVPQLMAFLAELPPIHLEVPAAVQAPVLVVPRVFEPKLCRALIQFYKLHGGEDSGFMREVNGRTVPVYDYGHKRRRDQEITDEELRNAAMHRIYDRLVPEIFKAFQFQANRMERHIVACYDGETGGHFRPHRDNTTKGTAHRCFAVSLNLNTGEYEGGCLRFPEFGQQTYQPPVGGAIVFSCSLLHEATPITQGRRYAYLPFLYDQVRAKVRQANQHLLGSALKEESTKK
ncbi:2OG-Fe(II) oxygenase [uncultured Nostoc sp.]|uniref:2OG-Fe(II) oxygenase n=1 Tax=uncultured Nostoc sp. TaxID=340711 RepID=UPI0035CC163D